MIFKVLSGPFFAPPIAVLHVDDFPTDDRAKVGNFINTQGSKYINKSKRYMYKNKGKELKRN